MKFSDLIRVVIMAAALAGSVWIANVYPTLGFASFAAMVTLFLSIILDLRRIRVEAKFFVGPGHDISVPFSFAFAVLVGVIRSIVVFGASLLLFSPYRVGLFSQISTDWKCPDTYDKDTCSNLDKIDQYLDQVALSDNQTLIVFFGVVGLCVLAGMALNGLTNRRSHRWTMMRLVTLLSVVFAIFATIFIPLDRDKDEYATALGYNPDHIYFQTGKGSLDLNTLRKEVSLINSSLTEALKQPADETTCTSLEEERARKSQQLNIKREELSKLDPEKKFFRATNEEWKTVNNKIKDLEKEIKTLEKNVIEADCTRSSRDFFTAILISLNVLNDMISSKTITLAESALAGGIEETNERDLSFFSILLGTIFSSAIIQGPGIATFVTLLLAIWNFGRPAAYETEHIFEQNTQGAGSKYSAEGGNAERAGRDRMWI